MIEVIVVSKNPLVSVAKWQQEIDRAGFGLALETPIPIESLDGFVSAKWTSGALNYSNRPGFECRYLDLTTAQQIDGLSSLLDSHSVIFTLGWVEHPFDRIAVQIAALAYAIGTDGTIFLPCKGVSTPDALLRELKAEDKYGYTSPSLVTGHGPRWKGEDIYRYNERPKTLIKNSAGTELHKLKRAHYAVLVGRNNSGKSFALKALTAHWGKHHQKQLYRRKDRQRYND